MATTRHGQKGIGVRPYAGFSPKSPAAGPKSSANVTRLLSIGIGGRKRKVSGKGTGPFTRLTTMGINGRPVEFQPKTPIVPPVEGIVTRLLTFGIGGTRVAFEPKTPASTTTSGGTTKKAKYGKKKKKWTEEELKGLEDYGKARLGITDEVIPETIESIEEKIAPIEQEVSILETETVDLFESPLVDLTTRIDEVVTLEEKLEDEEEILLLLAIIEAHNS